MPLEASLHIETALRNGQTVLQHSFCTHPFKLADVTEGASADGLRLMVRSSSPGVLDGDAYNIKIALGEGCTLHLETQSYQRLFQMQAGASQAMDVTLADGASLTYLPHPVVPHAGAVFKAVNTIHLGDHCRLLWGEVTNCGRKLNGEVFRFTSYHNLTKIYKSGRLAVKENVWLQPLKNGVTGIGQMEGFTHQSSLLYVAESLGLPGLQAAVTDALQSTDGIAFGVSALPVSGLIVRVLGHKAGQLFDLQKTIAAIVLMHPPSNLKSIHHAG